MAAISYFLPVIWQDLYRAGTEFSICYFFLGLFLYHCQSTPFDTAPF